MATIQTLKNRTNKELQKFNDYFAEIPLSDIFAVVEKNIGMVVQEDGTRWSGFLCGEAGQASFQIAGYRFHLQLDWYKMQSGRYEIVVYIS